MTLTLNPKRVLINLVIFISVLLIFNILDIILRISLNYDSLIVNQLSYFNFTNEKSIPTMYSAFALVMAGILLFIISLQKNISKTNSYLWKFLSLIFFFLATDEYLGIHERIGDLVQRNLNTSGKLLFAWVIPYSIFAVALAILYSKFLYNLKRKYSILFIVSGAIFIFGAVGLELFESERFSILNEKDAVYHILGTIEEYMEMFAIILFIYALTLYIQTEFKKFSIKI